MSYWQMANAVVSVFAAGVLTIVILHPRIHEGLAIKSGLMAVVFGLMATAGLTVTASVDWDAYWRAGFAMRSGLALVCVGVLYRARKRARKAPPYDAHAALTRNWIRRISDPVYDLAHLLSDEPVKRKETTK